MTRSHRLALLLAGCLLLLGACGDDDTSSDTSPTAPEQSGGDEPEQSDADEPSTNPGATGGAAVLVIGDETWEFDAVQCAFGAETNSADWDFSLLATRGGLNLIVDRAGPEGRFGDSISMFGGEDPTSPAVAWEAPAADLTGGTPIQSTFVVVDGKSVTAETTFFNDMDASGDSVPGSVTATCP